MSAINRLLGNIYQGADNLSSVLDLFIRLWIAQFFFLSGLTKIANWQNTVFLFEYEYDVPFLPPEIAAYGATVGELVLPPLLALGFATRFSALALFILNAVAIYSYRAYLFDQGTVGLVEHFYWGFLMLIPLLHGAGRLSADYLIAHKTGFNTLTVQPIAAPVMIGVLGMLVSLIFLTTLPVAWKTLPLNVTMTAGIPQGTIGYIGILISLTCLAYSLNNTTPRMPQS